jgi:hypothetical protein
MAIPPTSTEREIRTPAPAAVPAAVFGVNEVRLNARHWTAVIAIFATILWLLPVLWQRLERLNTGQDYRVPYELSKDYWLYSRRLRRAAGPDNVILLGDSVVWGEYVLPNGTLSHFLNQQAGVSNRFVNAGVNGLFPLAEEGLVRYYGKSLRQRKVLLHCNVLWMTSPKADLSTDKEDQFNHATLVPQFFPRIPCYRANANDRLSAEIANHVEFIAWISHLQNAYFGQRSIPAWTLQDDGGDPPKYPNAYRNPLSQITMEVPAEPSTDPLRGPQSPRHKPWSSSGQGTTRFDWVPLQNSFQWAAFKRLVELLRSRNNDVLVLLGPFNEHMIAEDNRPAFRAVRDGIVQWLAENHLPSLAPDPLASDLYADASHPLTDGYQELARRVYADSAFQEWLKR